MLNLAEIDFATGRTETALHLASQAADYFRTNHQLLFLLYPLGNLSAYSLALSRYDDARRYACEALLLARKLGQSEEILGALQHLVAVAILDDGSQARDASTLQRATNVLGFVDGGLDILGLSRDTTKQKEYAALLVALRNTFGESETEKLMSDGKQLSEDQAVAEALAV